MLLLQLSRTRPFDKMYFHKVGKSNLKQSQDTGARCEAFGLMVHLQATHVGFNTYSIKRILDKK